MSLNKGQDPIPISYMMKLSHYYIHLNLIYQKSALTEYNKNIILIIHVYYIFLKSKTVQANIMAWQKYIYKKKRLKENKLLDEAILYCLVFVRNHLQIWSGLFCQKALVVELL